MTQPFTFKFYNKVFLVLFLFANFPKIFGQNNCPFDKIYFKVDSLNNSKLKLINNYKDKLAYNYKFGDIIITIENRYCYSYGLKISYVISKELNGDDSIIDIVSFFLKQKEMNKMIKYKPEKIFNDFIISNKQTTNFEIPTKIYDTFHIFLKKIDKQKIVIEIEFYIS